MGTERRKPGPPLQVRPSEDKDRPRGHEHAKLPGLLWHWWEHGLTRAHSSSSERGNGQPMCQWATNVSMGNLYINGQSLCQWATIVSMGN